MSLTAARNGRSRRHGRRQTPALGTIKKIDDLQTKVARAQNNPNELRGLLVKDFNIKDTLSTAWLSYEDIDNAETFDLARCKNKFAIGGADLSKTLDLTCATLLMIDKDTGKRCVTQMYWIPEETLERRVAEEKRYPMTSGGIVDYCALAPETRSITRT